MERLKVSMQHEENGRYKVVYTWVAPAVSLDYNNPSISIPTTLHYYHYYHDYYNIISLLLLLVPHLPSLLRNRLCPAPST